MSFSRWPYYGLVGLLLVAGVLLILYRHWVYEVPLWPGKSQVVWSVEAIVEFQARDDAVHARLAIPSNQTGFLVVGESGASQGYGLTIHRDEETNAEWTIRKASGVQQLFYRVELMESDAPNLAPELAPALTTPVPDKLYSRVIREVMAEAYKKSADHFSLTRELLKQFNRTPRSQSVELLLSAYRERVPELIEDMLNLAQVPARVVYGLKLQDGRRQQELLPYLRVWQDGNSEIFELPLQARQASVMDEQAPLLLWEQRGEPILDLVGGRDSRVRFSMIRHEGSAYGQLADRLANEQNFLNFSIHSLPLEEQAMFKTILLLPIGALVVCILRILVGLRTSGTFMPVLIALAFIQTSFWTGLTGFLLVVASGLVIRGYLSRLNLLLVARISAVIVVVIAIIGIFSVTSYKVGLTEGLKITFFPMVIMAWTIERMSILWEEEGGKEVFVQGGGSLLTATLAYLMMSNEWIRHMTFNFVGVQLVVLALILILGSYTGYRLLELVRFQWISKS